MRSNEPFKVTAASEPPVTKRRSIGTLYTLNISRQLKSARFQPVSNDEPIKLKRSGGRTGQPKAIIGFNRREARRCLYRETRSVSQLPVPREPQVAFRAIDYPVQG
jgi:hypothetical protein